MRRSYADSPQLALDNLAPDRITFARELSGLTKAELADKIARTPSAITQFENGKLKPNIETLVELSFALGVPTTFFRKPTVTDPSIQLDACHFRALRATTQAERRQTVRLGELYILLHQELANRGVAFPEPDLPTASSPPQTMDDVEEAATRTRQHFGLGLGPLPHLLRLLEAKGVLILPLPETVKRVDAYSVQHQGQPCMMLPLWKPPSRVRFDAAHELGHLIMHKETDVASRVVEDQAHRFAGALLAPRESFLPECPRKWSLPVFSRLKLRWRMSVQALVRRALDLGQLSPSGYRSAFIHMAKLERRRDEGPEWDAEMPILLEKALFLLKDELTLQELAGALSIRMSELRRMLRVIVAPELLAGLDREGPPTDPVVSYRRG